MKFSSFSTIVLMAVTLGACSASHYVNDDAYAPLGHPEALLNASSEKVKFSVNDELALEALSNWLEEDAPTRAQLSCGGDAHSDGCGSIKSLLAMNNVPVDITEGEPGDVVLVYERVVARPCQVQFVSNHQNPHNLNHPSLGCATAMNTVQMVEDYRQLTNPQVSDPQDAEMAVKAVRRYQGINDPYYPY